MNQTRKITLDALFLALGLVLPLFTGQIPQIGNMLLPMHFPVFLCALICGWQHGLLLGFITPLIRSMLFGVPYFYPTALAMSFELASYGIIAGFLYRYGEKRNLMKVYLSLLVSMVFGRIVWGIVEWILLALAGNVFTWQLFITGAFFNAIAGIIAQLIIIPLIMVILDIVGVYRFKEES